MADGDTMNGQGHAHCILCREKSVEQFLDLGRPALANKFLSPQELSQAEPTYPLCTGFCRACGHVQLMEAVPPQAMFEDYLYISSASDTLKAHLYELSDLLVKQHQLRAGDLVIDIGCNDGTLLKGFRRHGVRTLGVDPAVNLAALAQERGVDRYVGFFNATTAQEIRQRWGRAAVITATNTFPHIPDLHDFMEGIKTVLAPQGAFVIEAHYLMDLLDQCAFDTIYHEHVSYWALRPMTALFTRHGLEIVHAERVPLHHGQLRVTAQRAGISPVHPSVSELLSLEQARQLDQFATYQRFAQQTRRLKAELRDTLGNLHDQGKRIAGYGAPAKGNTLLSFLGL